MVTRTVVSVFVLWSAYLDSIVSVPTSVPGQYQKSPSTLGTAMARKRGLWQHAQYCTSTMSVSVFTTVPTM